MGQSKPGKCAHCHKTLPPSAIGGGELVYCPFCGKSLKSPKSAGHQQAMQQTNGGYILSLGDDPVMGTPAIDPDGNEMPPSKKAGKHHSEKKSGSSHATSRSDHARSHHASKSDSTSSTQPGEPDLLPKKKSDKPTPPNDDDTADLLVLDLDMVKAEEEKSQSSSPSARSSHAPSRLKHVGEPTLKPSSRKSDTKSKSDTKPFENKSAKHGDDMVLPLLDEPVAATPRRNPPTVDLSKSSGAMDDTLAGLEDEEDQLDLAAAEDVVQLQVDDDDDSDISDIARGLVVTDAVDEDEFDTEIKPEETVPVVGLNMLQEHVGKASSWDRVPVPELAAASDQSSVYELAVEPEVAAGKICPECQSPMAHDAVVCAACGYHTQLKRHVQGVQGDPMGDDYDGSARYVSESQKYEDDQEYYHQQHLIQDVYIPTVVLLAMLVFLVFTVVITPYEMVDRNLVEAVIPSKVTAVANTPAPTSTGGLLGGALLPPKPPPPPPLSMQQKWFCIAYLFGTNLMEIAIKIPFMFVGMMLVIRLFGVSFGGVFSAMTKILAIAMTAHVLGFFIKSVMFRLTEGISVFGFEWYVSFPFTFISFIGLAMKFFELDVIEAFVLFLSAYLLPFFASMLVMLWLVSMLT